MVLLGRLSHVAKIILSYVCALILIGIGVSLSRGGWIATALTLVCFFVTLLCPYRSRWIIISVLLVSFASSSFYIGNSVQFQNRFQKTFVGGKVEDSRFDYWKPTISMWKDQRLDRCRSGSFRPTLSYIIALAKCKSRPQYAHNDYLNALAEWGVTVGCSLFHFACCSTSASSTR